MFDIVRDELSQFESALAEELQSSVDFIQAIGDNLTTAGGKRFRPALSFLAGKLMEAPESATMRVAVAVELLHSASLLHDDLIDDAQTRRGKAAAFRRYGNVVSVMSGDFMLARVLGLLAKLDSAAFTRLMAETAARICEAEVLQFQMATLETYSFENYFNIIEGKTAVLLVAAMEGVALLAEAPEAQRQALRSYACSYGRAFQMQDDYLDLMGDAERLGKPLGGDLREGKATYPVLLLLEQGVDEAREILRRHAGGPDDVRRMAALVKAQAADVKTRLRIEQEAQHAIAALQAFEDGPVKAGLVQLAERELERAA